MSSNQYDTIRNLRRDQGAPKASTAYSSSYSSGGGETFSTQPTEPVKPRAQASGPTGMERLSGMFGGNGPRRNFNMDALFKMDDMVQPPRLHTFCAACYPPSPASSRPNPPSNSLF